MQPGEHEPGLAQRALERHLSRKGFFTTSAAAGNGGAIWHHANGGLTLTDVVITNCEAFDSGGAVYSLGSLTMRDCTISNNRAVGVGGGIVSASYGTVRIERTTTSPVFSPTRICNVSPCSRRSRSAYCLRFSCMRSAA